MNVTWNVVRKDLRRFALPVSLWAAFVAGVTLWFLADAGGGGRSTSDVELWGMALSTFATVATMIRLGLTYVLAGALVLEDSVRGAVSFWLTRPVSKARLLRAKALAAAILLIVIPVAVLSAIWGGSGFGAAELCHAAARFALAQAVAVIAAFATASLSRSLTEFAFLSIAAVVAYLGFVAGITHAGNVPAGLRAARSVLVQVGMIVGVVTVLVHQFLTRRTCRSWVVAAAAVAGCAALGLAWPWSLPGPVPDGAGRGGWRRLGEVRVERGAVLQSGSHRTRVVVIELAADGSTQVVLQERDSLAAEPSPPPSARRPRPSRDAYLLLDAPSTATRADHAASVAALDTSGRGVPVNGEEMGRVELGGYVVRFVRILIPAQLSLRSWHDPRLAVLRQDPDGESRPVGQAITSKTRP